MITFSNERRFLVPGATGAIGRGVALALNELGASVVAVGRSDEKLTALRGDAKFPENMAVERRDFSENIAEIPQFVKALKEKYGRFQGLAYCAGLPKIQPLRAVDWDGFQRLFAVNYFAPIFWAKGFADKRNNNGPGSAIVFVASADGVRPEPGTLEYAGSKGALIASARSIALELAPASVRVNCVSPSLIDAGMADETAREFARGKYPMGLGTVPDVANLIVYLLAEESRWITGQNYIVDCGAM